MKIKVNTKAFLSNLKAAFRAVPASTANLTMKNVQVMVQGDTVGILYSNGEISILASLKKDDGDTITVLEEGVAMADARTLLDIISAIDDETVTIEKNDKKNTITVKHGKGHSELPNYEDEFPPVTLTLMEADSFDIPKGDLEYALKTVVDFCSTDSLRPALMGVLFDVTAESLTLVGTDASKLATIEMPGIKSSGEKKFLLDSRYIKGLVAAMKIKPVQDDETVTVKYDDKYALVSAEGMTCCIRMTTGKFPDYRKIIPAAGGSVLTIGKDEFLSVIKRITVCASRTLTCVKLRFTPALTGAEMEISAQDLGFMTEAKETMPVDYTGEELTIGFRPAVLEDTISAFNSDKVLLSFSSARTPVLITPETDREGMSMKTVIMPVPAA